MQLKKTNPASSYTKIDAAKINMAKLVNELLSKENTISCEDMNNLDRAIIKTDEKIISFIKENDNIAFKKNNTKVRLKFNINSSIFTDLMIGRPYNLTRDQDGNDTCSVKCNFKDAIKYVIEFSSVLKELKTQPPIRNHIRDDRNARDDTQLTR